MHRRETFLRDEAKQETRKSIVPCVCHHGRAQTFREVSKNSEHGAEDCDEHHAASTFVTVTASENDGGRHKADINVAAEDANLLLQISAKDNFLHESRGATESNPHNEPMPLCGASICARRFASSTWAPLERPRAYPRPARTRDATIQKPAAISTSMKNASGVAHLPPMRSRIFFLCRRRPNAISPRRMNSMQMVNEY